MTDKTDFLTGFVSAVQQDTEQLPPREREGFKRLGEAVADSLHFARHIPPTNTCFYHDGKPVLEILHEGDVVLRLYDREGHLAVRLFRDGTVKLALGVEVDEVVRRFWAVMAQLSLRPSNPKQAVIEQFCNEHGLTRDEFDWSYYVTPVSYQHYEYDGASFYLGHTEWEIRKISDLPAVVSVGGADQPGAL